MKKTLCTLLALVILFCLCACGSGGYTLTLENQTGTGLSDIRISGENSSEWGGNRIKSVLPDGQSTHIDLGNLTEDHISDGFSIQVFDNDDYSIGVVHYLKFNSGDKITLYLNGDELGALVNGEYISSSYPDEYDYYETENEDHDTPSVYPQLEGVWYPDGDLDSMYYVEFDGNGGWGYYERFDESAEGERMDYGRIDIDDEYPETICYAVSELYDLSYQVVLFDTNLILFGPEGTELYRAENGGCDTPSVYPQLEGVWYPNGDLDSLYYVEFDGNGGWGYYERSDESAEGERMDHGRIDIDDEYPETICYAVSELYDLSYQVVLFDTNLILFGPEGTELYRAEG